MRTFDKILTAIPILAALSIAPTAARAQAMTLGEAANYALLGLNNGTVRAETGWAVAGDFGYSAGIVSTTNKSIGSGYFGPWTGTAYVHSGVTDFDAEGTYTPTGGIVTNPTEDQRLDRANADALAHSQWVASLPITENLGAISDVSVTRGSVDGLRTLHVFEVNSLTMNRDVLSLVGDAADVFVFNVRGNLRFSQSEVRLTGGLTADHVLFNLPAGGNYTKDVLVHNYAIFRGTILAPGLGDRRVELDRSLLQGAIVAKRIEAHNHFSLKYRQFTATVCPCTGPAASVTDDLPSCNSGMDPVLSSTRPVISTVAQTQVSSQFPSSVLFLLASFGEPTPLVFPGTTCTIYVDLLDAVTLTASLTDGGGSWSYGIAIPPVCDFVGLQLALQAGILDDQVAGPIPGWVSNGVRMTVGL